MFNTHSRSPTYDLSSSCLNFNQHGFRQQRSCVTHLLQFVHTIAQSLDAGIQTDVIYLDMAKAFDKVPYEKSLYKLENTTNMRGTWWGGGGF